jgi:tRNA(Ile)-lysidine synthase TilS/MesJ
MRLIEQHLNAETIVCVSGGCDSIALSHVLWRRYGVQRLYHFNHGTPQADAMQSAVEAFANDFGMSLVIQKANRKLKTEAEFREARLEYIRKIEGVWAMAHNLDEATESYCLRFFTGHPEYMPIPLTTDLANGSKIIHPFLLNEKENIRKYITRKGLTKYVVEDISNHDPKSSRRSWVRNEFLPLLQTKQIGLKKIVRKKILETK